MGSAVRPAPEIHAMTPYPTTVCYDGHMPPTVVKIQDREGDGECGACGRTGLRWVVTLSDGSTVGTECTKRILGIAVAPANYAWTRDYEPVAEKVIDYGTVNLVLWRSKATGVAGRTTHNGVLYFVGAFDQAQQRFEEAW